MSIKPTWKVLKQFASSVFLHTEPDGKMFVTSSWEDYRYWRYRCPPEDEAKKVKWVECEPQVFEWEFIIAWARNNSYWNEISKLTLHDENFPSGAIYYVMSMADVMQLFFTEWVSITDEWVLRMEFVFQKRWGTLFVCPYSSKVKKQIADEELRQSQMGSWYKPWDIVIDWWRKYAYLWKWDVDCISNWDRKISYGSWVEKCPNSSSFKWSHIFISMECESTYIYQTRFLGYKSKPRRQITWEKLTQKRLLEMIQFLNSTHEYRRPIWWQGWKQDWEEVQTYPITTTLSIPWILQIE